MCTRESADQVSKTTTHPTTHNRVPNARLNNKLDDREKATTARVVEGRWVEVVTAIKGFTTAIDDAVLLANRAPAAANQNSSKNTPSSSIHQESRKARVTPKLALGQDNVKKALLALIETKAQQRRKQTPDSFNDKLKKRALERNLRTERRHRINVLNEESAHNQPVYTTSRRNCVEQVLPDKDQVRNQGSPI